MYILALVASLALAIPTYGASLAFFLLFKSWYDNSAAEMILKAADLSLTRGENESLFRITQAAVRKVYKLYGTDDVDVSPVQKRLTLYTGGIRHPAHQQEIVLSIFRKSGSGDLNIKATEVPPSPAAERFARIKREMKSSRETASHEDDDIPL